MNRTTQPYADSIAYLRDELRWTRARSLRLASHGAPPASHGVRDHEVPACACQVQRLTEHEHELRTSIDARLARNREVGPDIGLDTLCDEYGLGHWERHLLLLAALPSFGNDLLLKNLSPSTALPLSGSVDIETAWAFMELSLKARMESLLALAPDAPLRKHGLIELDYAMTTTVDAARVGVLVSWRALARVVGIDELATFERADEE